MIGLLFVIVLIALVVGSVRGPSSKVEHTPLHFSRRQSGIFICYSLLIGSFTDILFRQKIFGLNFLIWSVIWLVMTTAAAYSKKRFSPRFAIFAIVALINGLLVYIRAESIVQFWSVTIVLVCISQMIGVLYAQNFLRLGILRRASQFFESWADTIIFNSRSIVKSLSGSHTKNIKVSKGAIISVFIGLVFIGLFSGSDKVFSGQFSFIGDLFSAIGDWLSHYNVSRFVSNIVWIVLTALGLALMIGRSAPLGTKSSSAAKFLSKRDTTIILVTLCVVFGFFILIQVKYLFAGGQLPSGLTYASYARRGYGELLEATLLASAVVYMVIRSTNDSARLKLQSILASVLVVLNSIVVLSAWKRLSLYETAYGWTMARFVARLGLICILLGSVLLLLWVNKRIAAKRLFGLSWHVVGAVLTIAAIMNPIGIIVEKNIVERPNREVPLDVAYISGFSADSIPAVCRYGLELKTSYVKEYEQLWSQSYRNKSAIRDLQELAVDYPEGSNKGLSRSYTLSIEFKSKYFSCLAK